MSEGTELAGREITSPAQPSPIFILGITPRSGTTYLAYLLRLHPDCAGRYDIFEDHFISHADTLVEFAQNASKE